MTREIYKIDVKAEWLGFMLKNGDKIIAIGKHEKDVYMFTIFYDADEYPLVLTGKAKEDDKICIKIASYRIELYVNGELLDEEWPYGDCGIENAKIISQAREYSMEKVTEEIPVLPNVLRTFENPIGWKPEEFVFVGDCMPYSEDGEYHVIYLKDRRHHKSKWRRGAHQWNHISTPDLKTWYEHPPVVEIDKQWEASICTGSHIKNEDTHYLYYTVRTFDGSPAPMCRSISKDGYHYEKDENFSLFLSSKYKGSTARDPRIVKGEDGKFHVLITTTLISEGKGCLAHLVSDDLTNFTELDPIYVNDTADEPECSDYFEYNGYYYLVYSVMGVGHYKYSKMQFGQMTTPNNDIIPYAWVPKSAQKDGRLLFAGFLNKGYWGNVMSFIEGFSNGDGTLDFEVVEKF